MNGRVHGGPQPRMKFLSFLGVLVGGGDPVVPNSCKNKATEMTPKDSTVILKTPALHFERGRAQGTVYL